METFDLVEHIRNQRDFSLKTFGPGQRTAGVISHIRKELIEIEQNPHDIEEWIDVILLAIDGAHRHGASPEAIADMIVYKFSKNRSRQWPDWQESDPNGAIEHVK